MLVLGIETSCDECSVAVVEDGSTIRGQVIATQLEEHAPYLGVVPEIASRTHTEWISSVCRRAVELADCSVSHLDGVAVTNRPGLSGSLVVGLSFSKALAFGLGIPFVGVDHILAHLYAPQLEQAVEYPFLGLLVSGGHTLIAKAVDPFHIEVLGTTIDDACGEAFDKVAKYYGFGFPGGPAIDKLAQQGDPGAYNFPNPNLYKGYHPYDVSYSGLKTAVVNQLDHFRNPGYVDSPTNIAASFQKAAIDLLTKRLFAAAADTGLTRVVVGGGVAANSYLRNQLEEREELEVVFPSVELCTDNGAMVAGLGYHYLQRGDRDALDLDVAARVPGFRKTYP